MGEHIAVFSDDYAQRILSGKKKADLRLSQYRCQPFGEVEPGDRIYIKPSGGKVVGEFNVGTVVSFEALTPQRIAEIQKMYKKILAVDEEFFASHQNAQYGTLMFIINPKRYLLPVYMTKKNRGGWKTLRSRAKYDARHFS